MGSFLEIDMGPKTENRCLCAVLGVFYATFYYKENDQYITVLLLFHWPSCLYLDCEIKVMLVNVPVMTRTSKSKMHVNVPQK